MILKDSHNYLSISGDERAIKNQRRSFGMVALLVVIFSWYAVAQMKDVLFDPDLSVQFPIDGSEYVGPVHVAGEATPGSSVAVNGYAINVDDEGMFNEDIPLVLGLHQLEFEAKSKLGKLTIARRQIMVQ